MIRLTAMGAPSPPTQPYRFGLFEFDPETRELRKQGMKIKLQGQPVEILALLLARPGEVITRDEFQKKLWQADTFVDFEHSLNAAMKRLRAALGDSAETPRFVETLARRGYRFIAPIYRAQTSAAEAPALGPAQDAASVSTPPPAPESADPSRRRRYVALAILAAVALIGVMVAANVGNVRDLIRGRRPPNRINSLVVLPLKNLSGDPEEDYFADGMTDAVIAHLAGASALRVISQTSSLHYKETDKPLSQIARELDVDAVVEGSVLRSGDRIRINVQLIEAAPEKRLWGQSYERNIRDVLTLQNEVARAIVDEIRVKLTPGEKARLSTVRAANPEANLEYVKGRFYCNKRTDEALATAVEYFQRATQKDPGYALAYAGLADSWVPRAWYAYLPPRDAFPQAKEAVTKALQLDPDLAEARTTLAFITLYYDWDWAAAEREFLSAIKLNPNYANAHHWYAEYLSLVGRHEAAIQESERARELDPVSSIINAWVGSRYFFARRYDMAVEQYKNVIGMDPLFVPAHLTLGQAYEQKGLYPEAVAELEKAVNLSGGSPVYVASLAHAYGVAGRTRDTQRLIDELKKLSAHRYVAAFDMAIAYLGLGDKDRVFASLEKAVEERSPRLLFLMVEPRFDTLRSDSRFEQLLRRIGAPR